jgi:hypothetical protein
VSDHSRAHARSQFAPASADFVRACSFARDRLIGACREGRATQDRLLLDLLARHGGTAFGREHGFVRIQSVADYRRAVPTRGYDELAPWIDRAASGEHGVLTSDAASMFLRTSGTTSASKLIPSTRHWRVAFRGPAVYAQWGTYLRYHPELIEHPYAVLDLTWDRREPSDYLASGVPYQSITNRAASVGESDWQPPWYHAPWFDVAAAEIPYRDRLYFKLRHFVDQDLRVISAVNPSTLVAIAELLQSEAAQFIEDVHDGTIAGRPFGPRNPARAREMEAMAARCGALLPEDLWPDLTLVVSWKAAMAAMYLPKIHGLYPHAESLPFMSTGTEGVVTIPIDRHPTAGILAVDQGFYEFMPPSEPGTTLLSHELDVGADYLVVMTQGNGLYRYQTGDVYRVVRMVQDAPFLEYRGRASSFSSFTGEKLTEHQVFQAIVDSLRALGLEASDYVCCPVWEDPPGYTVAAEPESRWPHAVSAALALEIDRQLQIRNVEYASKRTSGRLRQVQVVVVGGRRLSQLRSRDLRPGVSPLQIKRTVLQRDDAMVKEVDQCLQ